MGRTDRAGAPKFPDALRPRIGADNAAQVAQKAYDEGLTLRDACIAPGYLSAAEFDIVFHPEEMA